MQPYVHRRQEETPRKHFTLGGPAILRGRAAEASPRRAGVRGGPAAGRRPAGAQAEARRFPTDAGTPSLASQRPVAGSPSRTSFRLYQNQNQRVIHSEKQ